METKNHPKNKSRKSDRSALRGVGKPTVTRSHGHTPPGTSPARPPILTLSDLALPPRGKAHAHAEPLTGRKVDAERHQTRPACTCSAAELRALGCVCPSAQADPGDADYLAASAPARRLLAARAAVRVT